MPDRRHGFTLQGELVFARRRDVPAYVARRVAFCPAFWSVDAACLISRGVEVAFRPDTGSFPAPRRVSNRSFVRRAIIRGWEVSSVIRWFSPRGVLSGALTGRSISVVLVSTVPLSSPGISSARGERVTPPTFRHFRVPGPSMVFRGRCKGSWRCPFRGQASTTERGTPSPRRDSPSPRFTTSCPTEGHQKRCAR